MGVLRREMVGVLSGGRDQARHFRPFLKWQPVSNPDLHSLNALSEEHGGKWCVGSKQVDGTFLSYYTILTEDH